MTTWRDKPYTVVQLSLDACNRCQAVPSCEYGPHDLVRIYE